MIKRFDWSWFDSENIFWPSVILHAPLWTLSILHDPVPNVFFNLTLPLSQYWTHFFSYDHDFRKFGWHFLWIIYLTLCLINLIFILLPFLFSRYSFMSLWQIKSLPVPDLLAPGALVGIWVTNKQKYLRFTKTELFPHWSVELVAEWYWVKVTRKGELVTDLDSPHKKPYEPLLLGRFIAKKDAPGMFGLSVSKSNEPAKERSKFTPHENKSNVLSLRQKRKKMNECDDDDDEVSMTCYISDKNVATTMPQERTSLSSLKPTTGLNCAACSDHEYEHLDNFLQTVPLQSPRNDFLSCCERYHKNKVDLSDDMESLSDVVMQKEHDEQDVLELYESKCLRVTATDLKIAENVQHTDSIMNSTSKHSELLQRDTRSKDCQLLPHQQIICSVPCKIHSRKPPLNGELKINPVNIPNNE